MREQQVINDYPPMYDQIAKAFGLRPDARVVFSWGDRIYNPMADTLAPEIVAHEGAHGSRQGDGQQVIDWWKRYVDSPPFRLNEEVMAHRAEYEWLMAHGNRQWRRKALKHVADRLCAPLYGGLIDRAGAIAVLRTH